VQRAAHRGRRGAVVDLVAGGDRARELLLGNHVAADIADVIAGLVGIQAAGDRQLAVGHAVGACILAAGGIADVAAGASHGGRRIAQRVADAAAGGAAVIRLARAYLERGGKRREEGAQQGRAVTVVNAPDAAGAAFAVDIAAPACKGGQRLELRIGLARADGIAGPFGESVDAAAVVDGATATVGGGVETVADATRIEFTDQTAKYKAGISAKVDAARRVGVADAAALHPADQSPAFGALIVACDSARGVGVADAAAVESPHQTAKRKAIARVEADVARGVAVADAAPIRHVTHQAAHRRIVAVTGNGGADIAAGVGIADAAAIQVTHQTADLIGVVDTDAARGVGMADTAATHIAHQSADMAGA